MQPAVFVVEDTAAMILGFVNGALGTLTISDAAAAPWSWEMTSGENKLEVWSDSCDGWRTPIHSARTIVPEQDPLSLQVRHFVDVVRGEDEPLLSGRAGTRTRKPRSP